MTRVITFLIVIFLFSNCTVIKNTDNILLEQQRWTLEKTINTGLSLGKSWTFLPDNNFTEKEWYSGGAYWIHHYSGKYFYDANRKAVFLKYNKGESQSLKKIRKRRLDLKIAENDSILTVTDGWKTPKGNSSNITQIPAFQNITGNHTFKTERIEK